MSRYTLMILLLLPCFQISAQRIGSARVFVYGDIGAGAGRPNVFKPTANVLFLKRHELSLGYAYYERRGTNIPEDYDNRGLLSNDIIYPQESFSAATIAYGYVLYPKKRPDIVRYVLRAGFAIGHHSTPYNYTRVSGGWFGPNWRHDTRERHGVAFTINPVMHYTPSRAFGLSVGLYGVLGSEFSGGGVTGSLLIGKVSNKIHSRRSSKKRGS